MSKNTGTFTISCPISSDVVDRKIKLSFECDSSGINFLSVYVDPKDFAMALTGLINRDMEFELRGHNHVR